jgi:hypothetical protein
MAQISPERRERMQREKQANASGGGNYFSFKNLTKAQIRLAPLSPDENIGTKIVYYFINNKSYLCNEQTNGKPGVIARTIRALQKLESQEASDLVEAFTSQRKSRYLMKVIDRAEPDKVIWAETPKGIYDTIFEVFDKDGEDIAHPKEGRDIRISKTGSGLATEYSARVLDQCPLAETKEQRIALKEMAAQMSVAEETKSDEARTLEAIKGVIPKAIWAKIKDEVVKGIPGLDDGDGDADAGGDDEETPPPKTGKKVTKPVDDDEDAPPPKKPAAADEDDETPPPKAGKKAPPADADDEEAPPPKKPAGKVPPADEDDEVPPPKKPAPPKDDEDEEDAPKAGKKTAPPADEDDEAPPAAKPAGKKRFQVSDDE